MPRFTFSFTASSSTAKLAAALPLACPTAAHDATRVWTRSGQAVSLTIDGCPEVLWAVADALPATNQERTQLTALLGG